MDVLRHNGIRQIVALLDELDLNNLGLEEEATSYTITPEETKERRRKSHIPPVTTVPREDSPISGARQARRRPIAVREEKKETIDPSPAATNEKTTKAEAGQIHDTPNTVEGARSDDRSSPAAEQGSKASPRPGVGAGNEAPDNNIISKQLKDYLLSNNLNNIYQSAYQAGHSTATILLQIKSDIHLNLAQGQPTALVLLHLSAAFGTINYLKLFDCLSSWFGFSDIVLHGFKSGLYD